MEKTTHHPLRAQEDALKRALQLSGFTLHDDGTTTEIEQPTWAFAPYREACEHEPKPILLEEGRYALRSRLLPTQLASLKGPLPRKSFVSGRVYDGRDCTRPGHSHLEGAWAEEGLTRSTYTQLWEAVAQYAFGLDAHAELIAVDKDSYTIDVTVQDATFTLATTGKANELARALLGIEDPSVPVWLFAIDVDAAAIALAGLESREALYNPRVSFLQSFTSSDATMGTHSYRAACDLLRQRGFVEFRGLDVYEADCYQKMNMIQESWDTNNRGVQLVEPLGTFTGLPTVLTPALEEALALNYRAGEETCLLFEIRHIFLPGRHGDTPQQKTALSFGGFGPNLNKKAWKALVDEFLGAFGIENRFYIPTDRAIAYDTSDCWLVMDQNMRYLESNFGTISPIARANHGIDVPAFMAQFEFDALEQKATEEYGFIPNELR